jgi:hypothetical protein
MGECRVFLLILALLNTVDPLAEFKVMFKLNSIITKICSHRSHCFGLLQVLTGCIVPGSGGA